MMKGKSSGKQALSDHKKIGKRFIPPMLQLGKWYEVSWVNFIIPELLWLGLLNEYLGLSKGAALGLSLAKIAISEINQSTLKWFAPISAYIELNDKQQEEVINKIKTSNDIELIKMPLTPLVYFYPKCPLNFLFEGKTPIIDDNETILRKYKTFISDFYDRTSIISTFAQANAMYIAFITGLIKASKGTSLANFPEIEKYPNTDESKIVASAIRAAINGQFGMEHFYKKSFWPDYFWNRGLELEACYFEGDESNE
jgi:hypothetical protein